MIEMGEIKIDVMHTPGHRPSNVCFLVDKKKLITGDTLFVEGCGRVGSAAYQEATALRTTPPNERARTALEGEKEGNGAAQPGAFSGFKRDLTVHPL